MIKLFNMLKNYLMVYDHPWC